VKRRALLIRLSRGQVQNVSFRDFCDLVEAFGFLPARIQGSHHLFVHPSVPTPVNLQPRGHDAKPYQIRQFLRLVQRYNLQLREEP
jgi:predicted RNA binding protein YcfA (HicA-like mRNA interferase family)